MPRPKGRSNSFEITPPLLNSACPWATTLEDLRALYECAYTGAVTTRTCLLTNRFEHDPVRHQHIFFRAGQAVDGSLSFTSDSVVVNVVDDGIGGGGDGGGDDDGGDGTGVTAAATTATTFSFSSSSSSFVNPILATPGLSSLNTYGYSPITLSEYLEYIKQIVGRGQLRTDSDIDTGVDTATTTTAATTTIKADRVDDGPRKPFILSVTGTPDDIAAAYAQIATAASSAVNHVRLRLALEINLSCPNIAGEPPPAYVAHRLREYLVAVANCIDTLRGRRQGGRQEAELGDKEEKKEEKDWGMPHVGIKLPPYTWSGQFEMVAECLREVTRMVDNKEEEEEDDDDDDKNGDRVVSVVDFVTCTNTLGSSLVVGVDGQPVLGSEDGSGIGGLAGAALHPLALGNVRTFRRLLDQSPQTEDVVVVGVGGVEDQAGFERMLRVGAGAVACASALGRYGVGLFERISKGDLT